MSEHLSLVALSPSDLPATQAALGSWCEGRIAHLRGVVADLTKNLEIAARNRWGSRQSLKQTITRETQRIHYYEKIKAAVEAGYLIIPNFPVDAFAVRVNPEKVRTKSRGYLSAELTDVEPHLLPPGEGAYVDDTREATDDTFLTKDADGKTITAGDFWVRDYSEEIDFPLDVVKPVVLEATERAMAMRIFDRLGVVRERRADPIIVGQILGPKTGYTQKVVTCFVAWWLNTEDL